LLSLYRKNVKISKAVEELSAEGLKVNRKTVAKYYGRYKRDLPVGDLPRSGRPSTLLHGHYDFIDQKLELNESIIFFKYYKTKVLFMHVFITRAGLIDRRKTLELFTTTERQCTFSHRQKAN
jgi:hypothetical protein